MASVAIFTKDDTLANLRVTLLDPDNENLPLNIAGYVLKLHAIAPSGAGPSEITGSNISEESGIVEFDCSTICSYATNVAWPATYRCQIDVEDTAHKHERSEDFEIVVKPKF